MFLVFLLLFWGSDQNEMRHIHLIISLRWSLNAGLFVGIYYYSFAVLPLRTSVVLKGNRVESCRVTSRIDLHRFLTSRSKVHLLVAMDSHVIRFSWVDVAVKLESKKKLELLLGPVDELPKKSCTGIEIEHVKHIRPNPQANCAPHCNIHHIWEKEWLSRAVKTRAAVKFKIENQGSCSRLGNRSSNNFLPVRAPIAFM